MILDTMNKKQLLKELNADNDWLLDRVKGLRIKYRKALKNYCVKHNAILGISQYITPNGNKLMVCVTKCCITNKISDIEITPLFEFTNSLGYSNYIFPFLNNTLSHVIEAFVFTHHCIQRMQERSGIGVTELLKTLATYNERVIAREPYEYQGEETLLSPIGRNGGVIVMASEWGFSAVTYLDITQQKENQLRVLLEGRRRGEKEVSLLFQNKVKSLERMNRYERNRLMNAA